MLELVSGVHQYEDLLSNTNAEFAVDVESAEDDKYDLSPDQVQAILDGERKWLTSKYAYDRLEKFLTNLEGIIQADLAQNPDVNRRMPFVLRDIGYTSKGVERLDAHLDHTINGNKFMVLFARVAKAKGLEYSLQGDFIFLGFRPEHPQAAEILFSVLAQSYTHTGKGFNSVQAGRNMGTLDKIAVNSWNTWQKDVLDETPVRENAAAEQARFAEIEEEIRLGAREIVIRQIQALTLVKNNLDVVMGGTQK